MYHLDKFHEIFVGKICEIAYNRNVIREEKRKENDMENEVSTVDSTFLQKIKPIQEKLNEMALKYYAGLTEMEAKINVINEDFKLRYQYNPIHHVESRIKSPQSILNKMIRNGYPLDAGTMEEKIHDIVGVRIVCSFLKDIPYLVSFIKMNKDIEVLEEKDYIQNPKCTGYRSYHMLTRIPVTLTTGREYVIVEIQLRTMAMNFWASLEHRLNYKFDGYVPDSVKEELISCANTVHELDEKMESLNEIIREANKD